MRKARAVRRLEEVGPEWSTMQSMAAEHETDTHQDFNVTQTKRPPFARKVAFIRLG